LKALQKGLVNFSGDAGIGAVVDEMLRCSIALLQKAEQWWVCMVNQLNNRTLKNS
jgi:hypothetical protein